MKTRKGEIVSGGVRYKVTNTYKDPVNGIVVVNISSSNLKGGNFTSTKIFIDAEMLAKLSEFVWFVNSKSDVVRQLRNGKFAKMHHEIAGPEANRPTPYRYMLLAAIQEAVVE